MILILEIIVGFIFLIKGADYLVKTAIELAKKLSVSDLFIGLTIVAIGTSLPELSVNLIATANGNTDLILGNIFGSNLANTFLILGVATIIKNLSVKKQIVWADLPIYIGIAIFLLLLINNHLFFRGVAVELSRTHGFILLGIFLIYMIFSYEKAKYGKIANFSARIKNLFQNIRQTWNGVHDFFVKQEFREEVIFILKKLVIIILSSGVLYLGGDLVVKGATGLALILGMSESVIGLTIVAVGTSLPELFTSVIAAYNNNSDIAVGNIVGSNIINLVLILGLTIVIDSIKVNAWNEADLFFMTVSALIFWIFLFIGKKYTLGKLRGMFFLLCYFSYIFVRLSYAG